jgi:glycosyltransferase involved in cell wall biosynthesis
VAPRVAVVIPSYNHARFVGAALDSVLSQSRRPERVLVVDDGSSDETPSVVRSYHERGIELHTQENAGPHSALNRAVTLAAADCDVIGILNSDDLYHPGRLAACVSLLESTPETDVVVTAFDEIDEEGRTVETHWRKVAWSPPDEIRPDVAEWLALANFPASTSNIVARSSYLRDNPFRPYRFCHDYFFLSAAALRGKLAVVEETLLTRRHHPHNTIRTAVEPRVREQLRMQLDLWASLEPELLASSRLRERFSRYIRLSFDNLSGIDAGLIHLTLAGLCREAGAEGIERRVSALSAESLPELKRVANEGLRRTRRDGEPLVSRSSLAERSLALERLAHGQRRLMGLLIGSRWVSLGQLLGMDGGLHPRSFGEPEDVLQDLHRRVAASTWLRVGRRLGVRSARQLLALSQNDPSSDRPAA